MRFISSIVLIHKKDRKYQHYPANKKDRDHYRVCREKNLYIILTVNALRMDNQI